MVDPNPRQVWDVKVPMRDGVRLSADVYFPPAGIGGGPYPALIERNCYTNQLNGEAYSELTRHGYAVVLQDVRGRNDSEGDYRPIHQEHDDGYDSIEWLAGQRWCDGNVGTIGASYMGWTQWAAASRRPPHLRASFVVAPAGLLGEQEPFDHGILLLPVLAWLNLTGGRAFQSAAAVDWHRVYAHLPLRTMDEALGRSGTRWRDWLAHPALDDYWRAARVENYAGIDVPTVVVTGWWDSNLKGSIALHSRMAEAGHPDHHLIVGPWDHGSIGMMASLGRVDFGPQARLDLVAEQIAWFDRWLKGAPATQPTSTSKVFVTGANRWRYDDCWPPSTQPHRLYLHSEGTAGRTDGLLNTEEPGYEPPDGYTYDPLDPVVVVPGDRDFYPYTVRAGFGQASFEDLLTAAFVDPVSRPDVLVYVTAPVKEPLEIVGEPTVVLHASSDGPDTDWFVAVDDLFPDGRTLPLSTGQLRARFHESLEHEVLLVPGEVTRFRIPLRPITHWLGAAHRLRMTVTSSRFPLADRNPNTGRSIDADDDTTRVATNHIHHSRAYTSYLELPIAIVPADRP